MKHLVSTSRRSLLQGMAALGLATPFLGAVSGAAFGQGVPQRGGTLAIATNSDAPNFDIFSNSTARTLRVVGPCYNSLLMMDPVNPEEIIGDLAESWNASSDGLAYTFHIVRNARFHDGVPLTSADVKYTFDLIRNPPEGTVSVRRNLFAAVSNIHTPDDYTVVFELSRPSPAILSIIANPWCLIAPKHLLEGKGHTKDIVVGSGPFMLKSQSHGVGYELVRNPNYHVPDRPYLDGISIFVVPDAGTSALYLKSGQLQLDINIDPVDAFRLAKDTSGDIHVLSAVNYNGEPFVMNSLRSPFDDIRVRKAVALSTDHEDALKVVFGGAGEVAGFMSPGKWALPADVLAMQPGYGPDIEVSREEARNLLAEAGFESGFKTTILSRKNTSSHEERAVYLIDQFSKIGIEAEIEIEETATYLERMQNHDFDVATSIINAPVNDPDFLFADYHTCNGSQNYSGICNQKVDDLFELQSQTVDEDDRRAIVHEMELAAMNDFGWVVLYFKKKFVAAHRSVQGYVMHNEPDNNMRFQDIWLS